MSTQQPITATITLPPHLAYALAELCKRIGFADCRANAVDDDEAYAMVYATAEVREALADAGVVVR